MSISNQPLEGTKLFAFDPEGLVVDLKIIDLIQGNGDTVSEGATITAHYTGALVSSGMIFQCSHDFGQPVTFKLSEVIKGWTVGVPGMRIGGKRRLVIPAAMAYGSRGVGNIPPNSDLVFDIELVSIV